MQFGGGVIGIGQNYLLTGCKRGPGRPRTNWRVYCSQVGSAKNGTYLGRGWGDGSRQIRMASVCGPVRIMSMWWFFIFWSWRFPIDSANYCAWNRHFASSALMCALIAVIETLLCYLELHCKKWIENLQPIFANCTVQCYGGRAQMLAVAKKVSFSF